MQVFREKNVFLDIKSAYLQHLANVASGECWKIRSSIARYEVLSNRRRPKVQCFAK